MDYTAHVKTNRTVEKKNAALVTPQSQPIPGKNMVQNSAGGYSFELSDWDRLERFLILGSEGGTFYASEKQLTKKNAKCVERLLKKEVDGLNVVRKIVEISAAGRAHKNDPAIFALAMASAAKHNSVRKAALQAIEHGLTLIVLRLSAGRGLTAIGLDNARRRGLGGSVCAVARLGLRHGRRCVGRVTCLRTGSGRGRWPGRRDVRPDPPCP